MDENEKKEWKVATYRSVVEYMHALNAEVSSYEEDLAQALIAFTTTPSKPRTEILFRGVDIPLVTFLWLIKKIWLEKEVLTSRDILLMGYDPDRIKKGNRRKRIKDVERFLALLPLSSIPERSEEVKEWFRIAEEATRLWNERRHQE